VSLEVVLTRPAKEDIVQAAKWYRERSTLATERFLIEIDSAMQRVSVQPTAQPVVDPATAARRVLVRRSRIGFCMFWKANAPLCSPSSMFVVTSPPGANDSNDIFGRIGRGSDRTLADPKSVSVHQWLPGPCSGAVDRALSAVLSLPCSRASALSAPSCATRPYSVTFVAFCEISRARAPVPG
jgi:plasmid stabilization system protein ParE